MHQNLSDEEKDVMFKAATEAPFSGALLNEHRNGSFICKNCGALLFKSDAKFDSGSGWPSFTEPVAQEGLVLKEDNTHGMKRVEIKCKNCGVHLGHLFTDGPPEKGGLRYCVNSASLNFNLDKKRG